MRKIQPFISRVGCDSIALMIIGGILLIIVAGSCCGSIGADLCVSFVSAVIIFFVTTTIPRYRVRKAKYKLLNKKVENVIRIGKILLNNIYSQEVLCLKDNVVNTIPSNKEIEELCRKHNFRIAPTAYFYTPNEQPSWDLLFCKCLNNLNHTITEIVAIAGQEQINLVNLCEDIRKKIEDINISISVHISANPEIAEVRGDFICTDMQDLAKMLRELQEHNKWL